MKASRVIQLFLPKEEKFFSLIEQSTKNLLTAVDVFEQVVQTSGREPHERLARQLKELEHEGDLITHRIYDELSLTFVTPIDREDIHNLAGLIDDILDRIESVANRMYIYNVEHSTEKMIKLAGILKQCVDMMDKLVCGLRPQKRDASSMKEKAVSLNTLENEGDVIYREALKEMFEEFKDPIEIIKMKDLYQSLEGAIDKCEDVSNVIEQILIKYA